MGYCWSTQQLNAFCGIKYSELFSYSPFLRRIIAFQLVMDSYQFDGFN